MQEGPGSHFKYLTKKGSTKTNLASNQKQISSCFQERSQVGAKYRWNLSLYAFTVLAFFKKIPMFSPSILPKPPLHHPSELQVNRAIQRPNRHAVAPFRGFRWSRMCPKLVTNADSLLHFLNAESNFLRAESLLHFWVCGNQSLPPCLESGYWCTKLCLQPEQGARFGPQVQILFGGKP